MGPLLTVEQARLHLDALRPVLAEFVCLRADAAELQAALQGGPVTELGGMAELKAAQARLDELASTVSAEPVELKGIAPLLLDFPVLLDGEPALLCWLEGDTDLAWWHRPDLGFLGRRPLP